MEDSSSLRILQDSLLGAHRFTRENINFTHREAMNLLMHYPHIDTKLFESKNRKKILVNLVDLDGIGETQIDSIDGFFKNHVNINITQNLINKLSISNYLIKNLGGKFSKKKLMFTGGFKTMSRSEAKSIAENNGGKVHFILGNHEFMVMQNDLRYINKKYWLTSKLLNTPYNELYGKETVLGRWLRSKPTVLKIDDNLFLHAGISEEFISSDFDLEETNKQMRQSLIEDNNEPKWHSLYDKYYDNGNYFKKFFHTLNLLIKYIILITNAALLFLISYQNKQPDLYVEASSGLLCSYKFPSLA